MHVVLSRKDKFVGTKALHYSLLVLTLCLKHPKTKCLMNDHIQTILCEVTMPLLLITEKDFEIWKDDPIEYVRMTVDKSTLNIKSTSIDLIKKICSIHNKKMKSYVYLNGYIQLLATGL